MLDLLKLQPGMHILDVGCGAGKQCFSYYSYLKGQAEITGGDVSQDLLGQARQEKVKRDAKINFIDLNFNQRFPLEDNQFDLASCCFAIYYAENVPLRSARCTGCQNRAGWPCSWIYDAEGNE